MSKKILIADDEPSLRRFMRDVLGARLYQIIEAPDGVKAVALALSERPDLILLDWQMPQMNGVQVIEALRKEETTAGIPVILLTGTAPPAWENQGRSLGGCDYLLKPFTIQQLLQKVEKALV